MTKKKELHLTPASGWGDNTEIVELPSGNVAKLRRLNVLTMLERGGDDVPNFLKVYVARSIRGQRVAKNPMREIEDPTEAVSMITFLARQAFVYPKLVDAADADDEVCIDVVSPDDLSFAASFALGDAQTVKQLEKFRQAARANVEPVPAGEGVGAESEPDPTD